MVPIRHLPRKAVVAGDPAQFVRWGRAVGHVMPEIQEQNPRREPVASLRGCVGKPVLFANNDSVAHQVYSFSPTKHFELALYHGKPRAPVMFDRPGIVTVGCSIHDNMVGYLEPPLVSLDISTNYFNSVHGHYDMLGRFLHLSATMKF